MKTLHFSRRTSNTLRQWLWVSALVFLALPAGICAQTPDPATKSGPIEITADKLVTDNKARTAEFTGNVHAVQGDTEISAERLLLFYKDGSGQTASMASGDIERMEAYGKVRILFDNKVAVSDQAVYITQERKLILEGQSARVTSGKDQIEGNKITFYRDDGRVALEGNADNRVRAIIHSEQRGLN